VVRLAILLHDHLAFQIDSRTLLAPYRRADRCHPSSTETSTRRRAAGVLARRRGMAAWSRGGGRVPPPDRRPCAYAGRAIVTGFERRVARCRVGGQVGHVVAPRSDLQAFSRLAIGDAMVRTGWAWDFYRYSKNAYAAVEADAPAARVWSAIREPPWDWRVRQEPAGSSVLLSPRRSRGASSCASSRPKSRHALGRPVYPCPAQPGSGRSLRGTAALSTFLR
jgi:hypothetical protein